MGRKHHPETVALTGASAGVGRAVARRFARQGAHIGLMARDEERLEQVKSEIEELGGKAIVIPVDVAHHDDVEEAAAKIEDAFGPLDIWVNNAMVSVFSRFKDMTSEEFRRVTEVTYLGYVYGTMAALRRMLPRDQGTIVQVGSALAYRGIPLQSAYCGAKHAIQGFTESIRTELFHEGSRVHITMVQLPAVNTPQFSWVKSRLPHKAQPVPPIFQPEVPAEAIYWAAHHHRREINVGLSTDVVINGNKLLPSLGDRYLAKNGFKSQQTDEPEEVDRPHNLWEPVRGPFGAHGRFDHRAIDRSPHLWVKTHRGIVALASAALLAASYLAARNQDS